jgi:putative restriction endonuclease
MSAYQRPCAIPGSRIKPVLPAAHKDGGIHRVDNGMLLRSDVHKLFDDGYLDVERPLPAARKPSSEVASAAAGSNLERERVGHATSMPAYRTLQPEREA